MACIYSLAHIYLFTSKDTMLQMASCSYDVHVQEIIGGLIAGASIVMLFSQGNLDFTYVEQVIQRKQVSYMQSVPAYLNSIVEFLRQNNHSNLSTLRTLDIGGKWFILVFKYIKLEFLQETSAQFD